jgi:hypothetical protein
MARSYIVGGNLSLLFSRMSIQELEKHFGELMDKVNILDLQAYFENTGPGRRQIDFRVIYFYPVYPYTERGTPSAVSEHVRIQMLERHG